MLRHLMLLTTLCAVLGGCPPNKDDDPVEDQLGDCADGTELTWDDAGPVFEKCTVCHDSAKSGTARSGAPLLVNFDTPEDARSDAFLTWQMIYSEQMPRTGSLTTDEKLLLWEWLSCDGPE